MHVHGTWKFTHSDNGKRQSKVVPLLNYAVKVYRVGAIKIKVSLPLALVGDEWPASRPTRFTPCTHCIRGRVGPRIGLDALEERKFLILPGLDRPAQVAMLTGLPRMLHKPQVILSFSHLVSCRPFCQYTQPDHNKQKLLLLQECTRMFVIVYIPLH